MDKKIITKENWISNFTLIGTPVINDYTFKIDEKSERSSWIYNSMNIGINCGEKFGVVYAEMMGGYSDERENVIYAHGKDEDGRDDFSKKITIDWEDRFNDDILEEVGDLSFINIGIEKTDKGNTYYKKFLSSYDAIAYLKEHLEEDMVVNVRGNLKYSTYQDNVQIRKNINSIVLSKVDDVSKYAARFTQTILIDKESTGKENIDTNKGVLYVDARVLDYLKEYNGIEVRGQFPYNVQFEFEMNFDNQEQCKKIMDKLFKVKKNVTQITFDGEFIEGGATVTATWDDVHEDIKELVDCGVYTKEEALSKCSSNGGRERRMILCKPYIKLIGEDKIPELQKFEEMYTEDDLVLDYLYENDGNDVSESSASEDLDWLNEL